MKLNKELLEKAQNAKSVEELVAIAKENGIELTAEEAKTYFAKLNNKSGEQLADDELNNVAGGRKCGTIYYDEKPVVTAFNTCDNFCGGDDDVFVMSGVCKDCRYSYWNGSLLLCECDERRNNQLTPLNFVRVNGRLAEESSLILTMLGTLMVSAWFLFAEWEY